MLIAKFGLCRVRNWRLDSLDGVNAVTCNTGSVCGTGVTLQYDGGPANVISLSAVGPAGCRVQAVRTATAGSSSASVTFTLGAQSAVVSPPSAPPVPFPPSLPHHDPSFPSPPPPPPPPSALVSPLPLCYPPLLSPFSFDP